MSFVVPILFLLLGLVLLLGLIAILVIVLVAIRRRITSNPTFNSDEDPDGPDPWEEAGNRIEPDSDEPD
jgi:hypothetical protein